MSDKRVVVHCRGDEEHVLFEVLCTHPMNLKYVRPGSYVVEIDGLEALIRTGDPTCSECGADMVATIHYPPPTTAEHEAKIWHLTEGTDEGQTS